ncbi:Methylmalonyl-CoA mutase, small subunit protein [Minicystis rosea]|nr:Methylmalonyl-CoA mutase, small subunit protein [Minicystis rosea]
MNGSRVTAADWRAQVDKELAGRAFEAALVHEALAGVRIEPLYTETPPASRLFRELDVEPFRLCMRHEHTASADEVTADVSGGADALWLGLDAMAGVVSSDTRARLFFVFDVEDVPPEKIVARLSDVAAEVGSRFALGLDPIAQRARGGAPFTSLSEDLASLGRIARAVEASSPSATTAMVSTLPYHDAGADAADEVAIALSTVVRYLDALLDAGLSPTDAAQRIAVQIAVGRDTFVELCKLRALRTCLRKLLAAAGAGATRTLVHAVCSSRTLTVRDPWVNMLRCTTQMFSAILGGADLVTPSAFDQAFGASSPLGRRVARNTGLVLREESFLGKVTDPVGGSYYFETLTDTLAREAWRRFQAIERDGGIVAALESGRIAATIEATYREQLSRIAKRKVPILGVSEFANLDESLPRRAPSEDASRPVAALAEHRDAAAFEALRARAESAASPPEALLSTLGPFAESRARVGFAAGFFTAGGIRARESAAPEKAAIACICGSDERYATEAAERARALKAAGCTRVLLAGRPGRLEASLREAGVDGFIFVGCDVVATLGELLEVVS